MPLPMPFPFRFRRQGLLGLALLGCALQSQAWDRREQDEQNNKSPEAGVPAALTRLPGKGQRLLAYAQADLNRDGIPDYVVVVEANPPDPSGEPDRTLLIALGQGGNAPGGQHELKVVKRSPRVVLCSSCGGTMGDPFASLEAGPGQFSVSHYGGSSWRWSNTFRFAYSRRDDTWQLVEVKESSFHASQPDKEKTRLYKPPKDFGKIDIADFDPEHFKGVGPR